MKSVCVCMCVYQRGRVYISFLSQIHWASPPRLARIFPVLALRSANFLRNSSILGKPRQLVTPDTGASVLILSDATMNCYRAIFPSIVPVLLKCNWGKTLCKFWVCNVLIWYNVIQYHIDTAMWSLAWHQLIPPSCHIIAISFFLWWELLRSTVSVTFKYVVGQYMRSPELIHLLSRNLHLLTNISPFLSSSSL